MTRALYDSIYNLLCIYIFTQIKYKPMFVYFQLLHWSLPVRSLLLCYSLLYYFPVLIWFMYFWVLDIITSNPVVNEKE